MSYLRLSLLIFCLVLLEQAYGLNGAAFGCLSSPNLESQASLVHKIALIGKDGRTVIPKDQQQRYAATGFIGCGNTATTAQVTSAKNVITTAGHMFFDKDCRPIRRDGSCFFGIVTKSGFKKYALKIETMDTGGSCPSIDRRQDWVVIDLVDQVKEVTPYEVPCENDNLLMPGSELRMVSDATENFFRNGEYPKNIQTCFLRQIYNDARVLSNDCDTGIGSSGAAQFVQNKKGKWVFAAMNVAELAGLPDGREYDEERHKNASIPVSGDFLAAIYKRLKSNKCEH